MVGQCAAEGLGEWFEKQSTQASSNYGIDRDGKVVYEPKAAESAVKVLFLVKVSISDLNIRTGPGVNHSRVQFCPPGVYTIVAVSEGAGASMWGKLKSGIGWLSLDYVRRV